MSLLSVLNEAQGALQTTGYPAHIADFLRTDEDGNLIPPDDPNQYVLHLITGTPQHQWGGTRWRAARLQVNAWSTTEGTALVMLAAAETALTALDYVPLPLVSLGRDGTYTGYAQDYERGTD